jgi:3-deoxy-7-phosphoheptulonate synthase
MAEMDAQAPGRIDLYTSHECLHLYYEQAQTQQVPVRPGWFDLTTHFPWVGDPTRDPAGAHVEFVRGIANPIGVKLGPTVTPKELTDLIAVLDPTREPGRLTLIHRFGADRIGRCLPPLIEAERRSNWEPLWCCDPMHGNTIQAATGVKTRRFDDIRHELEAAFDIHAACGSHLGGLHFEMTGEHVTECVGGAGNLTEDDLANAYKSTVDPRLNYDQALELAFIAAGKMKQMRRVAKLSTRFRAHTPRPADRP